ncbi:MAG: nuclear transport factor 2 family protein [Acidobacteria bacterium]|nr:nuclear transport factor 2 family protein [Acidobacteriota bacterium]
MNEKTDSENSAEAAVLDANQEFYAAVQSLDMAAMNRIWLHQDWVFCAHPGWRGITGWKEIQESWEGIFSSTRRLKIQVHNLTLQLCGPIAWVTCLEEITSDSGQGLGAALAQATNIYMKVGKSWKLVHHHASPVPVVPNYPESERVQ